MRSEFLTNDLQEFKSKLMLNYLELVTLKNVLIFRSKQDERRMYHLLNSIEYVLAKLNDLTDYRQVSEVIDIDWANEEGGINLKQILHDHLYSYRKAQDIYQELTDGCD